jgi:hypothetical protein
VICDQSALIWAIPDLLPGLPDLNSNFHPWFTSEVTIPPLFDISFSVGFPSVERRMMPSWYFGSSSSIFFDLLRHDSTVDRFKIMLKPDLTSAYVQFIDSVNSIRDDSKFDTTADEYRLCEDLLFSCRIYDNYPLDGWSRYRNLHDNEHNRCFAISNGGPAGQVILPYILHRTYSLSSCPASGRFIVRLVSDDEKLLALDFYDVHLA